MENYLQELSGESYDNVTIFDIENALKKLLTIDEEHGAFWVSVLDPEENILEIDKSYKIIGIFQDDHEIQYEKQLNDFEQAMILFDLLLKKEFDEIKKHLYS